MIEQWKPIVIKQNGVVYDYTNYYEISDKGRVRSLNYHGTGRLELLKPGKDKDSYLVVCLSRNGKTKQFKIHRLVATMFIPNPDNLPQVNHRNEIKHDNRVENLEWCTSKYNTNYGSCIERREEKKKGFKHSEETKRNMSKNRKGSKNSSARKVICVETGQVFDTIKEAKEWLGKGDISACIRGVAKTAGGYHWMYCEE